MNYGDLKEVVLGFSHRADLSDDVANFVLLAEGMIARDLRSVEQLTITTLDDDDRITAGKGQYNLPSDFLEARVIYVPDANGLPYALENVSLAELKRVHPNTRAYVYTIRGMILEIAGVPGEDAEVELEYFSRPAALTLDADETDLLTNHPVLYIEGALFHLYKFTQDVELAQGALDTFNNAVETLNEQAGRQLGGARIAGGYNLGNYSTRHGY